VSAGASWIAALQNPLSLQGLYASTHGLEHVVLHELKVHRDGARLQLRFDLPRFPDRPAARWHPEYNTLQAEVSFWDAEALRIDGWSADPRGELTAVGDGDRHRLHFRAEGVEITSTFRFARLDAFSPYLQDLAAP
jgi:hypothetical protein